jgi:hypothetical protein
MFPLPALTLKRFNWQLPLANGSQLHWTAIANGAVQRSGQNQSNVAVKLQLELMDWTSPSIALNRNCQWQL